MKSIFSKLSLAAVLCVAAGTQAQAANVYYTSQYVSNRWQLSWSNLTDCDSMTFFNGTEGIWTLTVSGVPQPAVSWEMGQFNGNTHTGSIYIPGPAGTLDSALLAGTTSFVCGSDTIVIGSAPVVSAPINTVPTLTEWGMMAMGSLIAGFGAVRLRRRERSAQG